MPFIGELCAIGAAVSNGTLGVLNRFGFAGESSHEQIAFFRALGGFIFVSMIALLRPRLRHEIHQLRLRLGPLALCAFLGVFVLYASETWAFLLAPIPVVSFLTYASGIITIFLGIIFLGESLSAIKMMAIALVGYGIYEIFGGLGEVQSHFWGALLAIVGGTGYSLFLFCWRAYKIPGGLASLWWLLGCGSVYLSIPYFILDRTLPALKAWPSLTLAILVPTLGGFYLSGLALAKTESSRVQVIETSDPVFSLLFAWFIFGEGLTHAGTIGSVSILCGILILVIWPQELKN